jgi:Family of unknown function (DUF6049)
VSDRRRRLVRVMSGAAATAIALLAVTPAVAEAHPVPGDGASAVSVANAAADPQPAAAAAALTPITANLVSTSPVAPPVQATDTLVTVIVSVTNNSDAGLQQVQVRAVRDSPIIRPSALDDMLAHPRTPVDASLTQSLPTMRYPLTISAHTSVQLSYQFPASSIRQTGGVCLCQSGVYPIDLSVYAATGARASASQVGWIQTYLISVAAPPATEQVSWLWPLLDRPHRLSDTSPFVDDDLAGEVAPGGRLDRALQVLEQLGPTSPVTVVLDPEVIDELQQMTTGYRVAQGAASVAGTGGPAAADWLRRLRAVIADRPIAITPYGDPAIDAAAAANLTIGAPPAAMAARVDQALGRTVTPADSALAWPPDETVTPAALARLADDGTTAVILNDTTLAGGRTDVPALPAVATVPVPGATTPGTSVHALVTSAALEQRVSALLSSGGAQLTTLPALLSELALRTLQPAASPSYVVLTPTRYVDPNPATAAALIGATSSSSWASPIAAARAAATIEATDHGSLSAPDPAHYGGSEALISLAGTTTSFLQNFASVLTGAAAAGGGATGTGTSEDGLLTTFPMSIQLCQSAAWANSPNAAAAFGARLRDQQTGLTSQVQIVRPSNGSYSLASSSAPLLITVANNLAVPVTVRVAMTSVGGVAGFRVDDAGLQTIPANSRRTIRLQAHVSRSGHFRVQAQLLMPSGASFGAALPLSIYSSALGTIGVVITVVAGAILLLALAWRFVRRWRHHRDLIRTMMTQEQPVLAGAHG